LAGFKVFRDAYRHPGSAPALEQKGIGHRDLDALREDVLNNRLPHVSWVIATAEGSEHPGPSSPAQGADYTSRVLEALTANPEVWSRTVFIVNFDENDGFFDHVPPPAVPSHGLFKRFGDSTVDTSQEYHLQKSRYDDHGLLLTRPYGLGPRVPMYAISPWSRGGWVCSQVFDHTSVLRFIAARFGVDEPNISPWRRAVCGDLTSVFNFADPNDEAFFAQLPETRSRAERARQLGGHTVPALPGQLQLPEQQVGIRPSRPLPYALQTHASVDVRRQKVSLTFVNEGAAAAVFHVYDRRHLVRVPRRYTVEAGKSLAGSWFAGGLNNGQYDLWVLGPNGYHRHFVGNVKTSTADNLVLPEIRVQYDPITTGVAIELSNSGTRDCHYRIVANAYLDNDERRGQLFAGSTKLEQWFMTSSGGWYDFTVFIDELPAYSRRLAGRIETGKPSISDPRMGMA
jgi:phospholipase C